MAQAKEQSQTMAQAQNRNTESTGEKRPRTRRPYYQRRPRRPQQPKEAAVPIHIYPLGGLGEVGKNMTVYECCGDMIIVDCGLVFPDSDMYGVDLVIPDFTFVVQNKEKIKGLLITHGHEDHIGSIPYLLQKFDLPIYGTRLTCGLIRNKLEEFGLAGKTKFVEITPKQKLKLGCFTVEPIHVNHSIPDAVAFAIDSPAGTIIQTGDFKIDYKNRELRPGQYRHESRRQRYGICLSSPWRRSLYNCRFYNRFDGRRQNQCRHNRPNFKSSIRLYKRNIFVRCIVKPCLSVKPTYLTQMLSLWKTKKLS